MPNSRPIPGIWLNIQRQRPRQWRRDCLPATLVLVAIWLAGLGTLQLTSLPQLVLWAVAGATGLIPILIVLLWLIPLPRLWRINGGWGALAVFACLALLALLGPGSRRRG
ncbi:MAG: hypothetical protein QM682_14695 [Paracoccus sp. (in: a-proteobacteria)]|uniref:hypothetical protein n=1 Tax=Paracoccus sp. TaxID=267 RepID=UPI0039E2E0D3